MIQSLRTTQTLADTRTVDEADRVNRHMRNRGSIVLQQFLVDLLYYLRYTILPATY